MNGKHIEKYISEYIEILTKSILDFYFFSNKLNNDYLLNILKEFNDIQNTSLLKKQVNAMIANTSQHITFNKNNKLTIDFESIISEVTNSNFIMKNQSEERELNMCTLLEISKVHLINQKKYIISEKEEATAILKLNIKNIEAKLIAEISKYDVEELLYAIYAIADRLSIISHIIAARVKNGESTNIPSNNSSNNQMVLLIESLNNMNTKELLNASHIVGEQKYYCDILFNIIYKMYLVRDKNKIYSGDNMADLLSLFSKASIACKMDMFSKSNELLYKQGEFLELNDLILFQGGSLSDKLNNIMYEIIEFNYDKTLTSKVQEKYKQYEGFSANNLMEFTTLLNKSISESPIQAQIRIQTYPFDKFREGVSFACNIEEYGIDKFIDSLVVKTSDEFIDSTNKISVFPLVKLNDNIIMVSSPLLLQAYYKLSVRMLQQSFTNNIKLKRYIRKYYDEALIDVLIDELNNKNINNWEHVCLDKISDNAIKSLISQKGITKEIDIAYIINDTLYFVEYKTWMISAFSVRSMLKEYKKADEYVKSHLKAIKIIDENKNAFRCLFGDKIESVNKIQLIMVFQNPNAFNYLNKNPNVIGTSFKDFKESIKSL